MLVTQQGKGLTLCPSLVIVFVLNAFPPVALPALGGRSLQQDRAKGCRYQGVSASAATGSQSCSSLQRRRKRRMKAVSATQRTRKDPRTKQAGLSSLQELLIQDLTF